MACPDADREWNVIAGGASIEAMFGRSRAAALVADTYSFVVSVSSTEGRSGTTVRKRRRGRRADRRVADALSVATLLRKSARVLACMSCHVHALVGDDQQQVHLVVGTALRNVAAGESITARRQARLASARHERPRGCERGEAHCLAVHDTLGLGWSVDRRRPEGQVSRRWRARPTRSTRRFLRCSVTATWCRRSGCPIPASARSVSSLASGCTSSSTSRR